MWCKDAGMCEATISSPTTKDAFITDSIINRSEGSDVTIS